MPDTYIEDDDERAKATAPLDEELDDLFDQITDCHPATVEGYQAVARCVVLSEGDLRDEAANGVDKVSLSYRGLYVVNWLLNGLVADEITPANCMTGPGQVRLGAPGPLPSQPSPSRSATWNWPASRSRAC